MSRSEVTLASISTCTSTSLLNIGVLPQRNPFYFFFQRTSRVVRVTLKLTLFPLTSMLLIILSVTRSLCRSGSLHAEGIITSSGAKTQYCVLLRLIAQPAESWRLLAFRTHFATAILSEVFSEDAVLRLRNVFSGNLKNTEHD